MPELRMYLVIEHSDHFGSGRLFRKTINTALDFEHYIVDPSDQMEGYIRGSIRTSSGLHGWYTDRDGDLVQKLLNGGWTE